MNFLTKGSSQVCWSTFFRGPSVVCKFFTFSTYSLKPLGQFQPSLVENLIWGWALTFLFKGAGPFGA